jgi:hypothetical protein
MQVEKKNIVQKVHHKIIQENYTIDTINELCSLIGISKKTFYKEYPSKEQFILDLLSLFNKETANDLEKLTDSKNESVIKVIETFKVLVFKTYQRNKIQNCFKKQNQLKEFLEEEFQIIFTNKVTKLLEKMNNASVLNIKTNYFLFSQVLVKFTIDAIKNNLENHNLVVEYLLINSLKGICNNLEHKKIDDYLNDLKEI